MKTKLLTMSMAVVALCVMACGCIQTGQINNPWSDGQAHSRGTGYNAASKGSAPGGDGAEAFQQIRADGENANITLTSDQAKATDLTGATRQGQATSEAAQAVDTSTAEASGDQSPVSTPTDANPTTLGVPINPISP